MPGMSSAAAYEGARETETVTDASAAEGAEEEGFSSETDTVGAPAARLPGWRRGAAAALVLCAAAALLAAAAAAWPRPASQSPAGRSPVALSGHVLCPGKEDHHYCDCGGDCENHVDYCNCAEGAGESCCGSEPDDTDDDKKKGKGRKGGKGEPEPEPEPEEEGGHVQCPGKEDHHYCDCKGDCENHVDYCNCPEGAGESCCGSPDWKSE